ncbi:MAG: hypothetical protein VX834_00285 [Myxococcota bacterium]|nr:hypothetical protein [Myxococcota bacterium]
MSSRHNNFPMLWAGSACRRSLSQWVGVWLVSLLLPACAAETIIHGVDEREANRIVELLADSQINATKMVIDDGRTIKFNISVGANAKLDAIRLLNHNSLPRRPDKGYTEVFSEGGLIPTSAEEKAKKLAALEGELERQLKLIDGVLDAQVQIVMPTESALRTSEEQRPATTASVTLRYLPGAAGEKPLTESQLQTLLAAGVENLTPDKVYPILTPVSRSAGAIAAATPTGGPSGSWLAGLSKKQVNMTTAAIICLILILCVLLVFYQLRLKSVRSKLMRLQAQIMKAQQRQTGDSLPPAG